MGHPVWGGRRGQENPLLVPVIVALKKFRLKISESVSARQKPQRNTFASHRSFLGVSSYVFNRSYPFKILLVYCFIHLPFYANPPQAKKIESETLTVSFQHFNHSGFYAFMLLGFYPFVFSPIYPTPSQKKKISKVEIL